MAGRGSTPAARAGTGARNKGETIAVISRDNIRVLHPRTASSTASRSAPLVLTSDDVARIKKAAAAIPSAESEAARMLKERASAAEKALERKLRLDEFEKRRARNMELSDIEREEREKADHLLNKAQQQRDENQNEIKKLNELILNAKCVTVRDRQIIEKKSIKNEHECEERRLDSMMEAERKRAIMKMHEREAAKLEERRRGAAVIEQQISQRQEAAKLEAERKEQETRATLATLAALAQADRDAKGARQRSQHALMDEVAKANSEAVAMKRRTKELDRDEDNRLLAYAVAREQQDLEKENEALVRRAERERELARLREAQRKMSENQIDQDALRARRAYEAYERDWRRKERETATRKTHEESQLRAERTQQQRAREHAIATEAMTLRNEFVDNLKRQREIEERIMIEEQEKHLRNNQYCNEIMLQIKEKEDSQRRSRADFFAEGERIENERAEQRRKLEALRERKILEAVQEGVPETLCNDIRRKISHFDRQLKQ